MREREIKKKKERAEVEKQKLKHIKKRKKHVWMRVKNKVYVCGGG